MAAELESRDPAYPSELPTTMPSSGSLPLPTVFADLEEEFDLGVVASSEFVFYSHLSFSVTTSGEALGTEIREALVIAWEGSALP